MNPPRSLRRRFGWMALLIATVALILLWSTRGGTSAEILTQPPTTRNPRLAFLGPLSIPLRGAWQSLRNGLFGPPHNVAFDAEIIEVRDGSVPKDFQFPPLVLSNIATQVWLVTSNEARALSDWGKTGHQAMASRLLTDDSRPAQIFISGRPVRAGSRPGSGSITLSYLPAIHQVAVDLSTYIICTEAATNRLLLREEIATNFAAGIRLQVPTGQSVFLVTTNQGDGGRVAVILTPTIHPPGL